MSRVTVQYRVGDQYGEFVAKSDTLDVQAMVDEMFKSAKPGLAFRFLGSDGVVIPTGIDADPSLYIPSAV